MTSKAELIALCKEKNIKGYSGKTKDELMKMLFPGDKEDQNIDTKKDLGQYFTTSKELQEYVFDKVKHKGKLLLEPSFGAGHLTKMFKDYDEDYPMHLYELETKIKPVVTYNKHQVITYGDFTKTKIDGKYKTIIGNPPYVKQKGTYNLYIKFIELCYEYLDEDGELIFIVPSDFIKLTSASNIIQKMVSTGSFTHFFFPDNETLFKDANVDVVVFRYEKGTFLEKCIYGLKDEVYCNVRNGIITFSKNKEDNKRKCIEELFDVYVGIVSGKDEVYKVPFGNVDVLTDDKKVEKFILINEFPSGNTDIDNHLLNNKELLLERRIKKFTDKNWFEWGAPRNIKTIEKNLGKPCIYIRNMTRQNEVAFIGKVQYFGGSLLCLIPKDEKVINETVKYLNTELFKKDYTYSGRFKIGHKQISNVLLK